jgi:hypothetical protein
MAFFTIFVAPHLSDRDYRRALRSGPTFVSSRRRDHQQMLASAGFGEIEELDLSEEFRETQRAWLDGRDRYADELIAAEGEASYNERRSDGMVQLAAIEEGLLRRSLFVCA